MIPLFLTKKVNEIKHFTSEANLSNFKQNNHYQLFNHYLNIHFYIATHPLSSQLYLHFRQVSSLASSLWFSQEWQLERSAHRCPCELHTHWLRKHLDLQQLQDINSICSLEPASPASIGSEANHSWISNRNRHMVRVRQDKGSLIFWLLLSHNLLFSNKLYYRLIKPYYKTVTDKSKEQF